MSRFFKNIAVLFITLNALFPLIASILLAKLLPFSTAVCLLILAIVIFLLGLILALSLDYTHSFYWCPVCKQEFQPTVLSYLFSIHTPFSRHLQCPHCHHTSWCKDIGDPAPH